MFLAMSDLMESSDCTVCDHVIHIYMQKLQMAANSVNLS